MRKYPRPSKRRLRLVLKVVAAENVRLRALLRANGIDPNG